jgi:hypothetical protein
LGSGLLATLLLPFFGEDSEIDNECAGLNFLEATSWTGFPLFGSWHPHASREGKQGPAFTTFVPNALYQPVLATNFALWMLGRASWFRQTRWPDVEDKRMVDILEGRFGRKSSFDPFENAQAAAARGDYATALRLHQPLAEQGNPEAKVSLGVLYAQGRGVSQDYIEAVKWFRLAAEQGHAGGQYNLGLMYDKGQGVPQDFAEALRWYHLAAAKGFTAAQDNLGVVYQNGDGVPQDFGEAVKWFRLGAQQGSAAAQHRRNACSWPRRSAGFRRGRAMVSSRR